MRDGFSDTGCPAKALETFDREVTASRRARAGWSHQSHWGRLLPEAGGLVVYLTSAADWHILLFPMLCRALVLGSVAAHGLGHALGAGAGFGARLRDYSRSLHLRGLAPFGPLFWPGLDHPEQAPSLSILDLTPRQRRLAAATGLAASSALTAIFLTLAVVVPANWSNLLWLAAAINLWILLTSWTDYATLLDGRGRMLFCGNFGILAKRDPRERGFLPKRFRRLAERLGRQTDIRGQQAGGIAVLESGGRFVGRKIVNEKRSDLTRKLLGAFKRRAALCRLFRGARPLRGLFHLVAHYRYGTSSEPSEIETHWHRWLAPRRLWVWSIEGQTLARHRLLVVNLITHNGDFDSWTVLGRQRPQAELGLWLGEILGVKHPARGDSPKIAGLLDLLLTQGQWEASLRLAYALQTGQALPRRALKTLARVFEQVMVRWVDGTLASSPTIVGCTSLAEVYSRQPAAIQVLLETLQQAALAVTRDWPETAKPQRQQIVAEAVRAFFHNDLMEATCHFMAHAQGTFGLVTTSSLEPGAVVLAADRQPLFVAAEPEQGILLYASEAAALKAAWGPCGEAEPGLKVYRYDLRDGDIVLLRAREDTADNTMTLLNRYTEAPPVTQRITSEALERSSRDGGFSGWIALQDNPCVEPAPADRPPRGVADRVLAELRDIPVVLDRIQREWDDPVSLNRRTAEAFAEALLHNACAGPSCCHAPGGPSLSPTLDLLLLGVENNLFLAQRFATDLRRLFPLLHVAAVDAVSYCEDPTRYTVGSRTVTLAISQSGQTFNTLDAVKFVQALHGLNKAGPVFVMTGEIDTLMGAALGQSVKSGAPWIARVFATGAGWRTAEPATVSTAATQATLTQLLLYLMRAARGLCAGPRPPFGLLTSEDDVAKLDALARLSVSRATAVLGRTSEGWEVQTAEREDLVREGAYLARLLVEPALVFLFTALHLFVMLWLGWNPVIGLGQFLHAETGWALFDPADSLGNLLSVAVQTGYFLFAGVAFTLILRAVQRRPLWDRVFVGRTLVIGEEPYIKDLLAQYVSKLFSLAYEFTGFVGIHAADARSGDLLHGYGHRITRGLLLFLGLPDGRWSGRERAEAAACMTCSQARGVRNLGAGATVIGLGHNPASADKVDHFVLLGRSARTPEELPWVLRGDWSAIAKDLQESRFASFERLLAAYVIFYTAAARTRDFMNRLVPVANLLWMPIFWTIKILTAGRVGPSFGRWDLARTQSGTRIATTASPVPAITLDPRAYRCQTLDFPAPTPPRIDAQAQVPEALASPLSVGNVVQMCPRRFFQSIHQAPEPATLQ